jgi:hypothetical protein
MLFAPIDMSFNYYANLLNPRAGAPTLLSPTSKAIQPAHNLFQRLMRCDPQYTIRDVFG